MLSLASNPWTFAPPNDVARASRSSRASRARLSAFGEPRAAHPSRSRRAKDRNVPAKAKMDVMTKLAMWGVDVERMRSGRREPTVETSTTAGGNADARETANDEDADDAADVDVDAADTKIPVGGPGANDPPPRTTPPPRASSSSSRDKRRNTGPRRARTSGSWPARASSPPARRPRRSASIDSAAPRNSSAINSRDSITSRRSPGTPSPPPPSRSTPPLARRPTISAGARTAARRAIRTPARRNAAANEDEAAWADVASRARTNSNASSPAGRRARSTRRGARERLRTRRAGALRPRGVPDRARVRAEDSRHVAVVRRDAGWRRRERRDFGD